MKNINLLLILLAILVSCSSPSNKESETTDQPAEAATEESTSDEGYILAFTKVDNTVNVYINDSLIYTSGFIGHSPELDLKVDLNQFITDGSEVLKIELWNGREPYDEQIDPLWEVRYDVLLDGELLEFVHEFDDDNAIGVVYEKEYVVNKIGEDE